MRPELIGLPDYGKSPDPIDWVFVAKVVAFALIVTIIFI